jgi:hypothetical protein
LVTDLGMSDWTGDSTLTLDLEETVVDRMLQNSNVLGLSTMPLSWQKRTAGGSTVYDKLVEVQNDVNTNNTFMLLPTIEYPPSVMTQNTETLTGGTYTASASGSYSATFEPYKKS